MRYRIILLALVMGILQAHAAIDLRLINSGYHDLKFSYSGTAYKLTTTGGDPYVYTSELSRDLVDGEDHLTFEYQSTEDLNDFRIYYGNSYSEARACTYGTIPSSGGEWKVYDVSLYNEMKNFSWGSKGEELRFDLGYDSGKTILIRNIQIYDSNNEEKKAERKAREQLDANLGTYVQQTYPCAIDSVKVTRTLITITGHCDRSEGYQLVECMPYNNVTEDTTFSYQKTLDSDQFTIRFGRYITRDGYKYDRMLSRWAIMDVSQGTPRLASHAHYADEVALSNRTAPEAMELKGKKGLGGFYINSYLSDLDDLNIHSVTVNVTLCDMIAITSGIFTEKYEYAGRTYYINTDRISAYDKVFAQCYKRGIVTAAILLVQPTASDAAVAKAMVHPDYASGYYTMANLTSAAGTNCFAAIISYLASRYNGATHGRINNWILYNEVDMGTEWTNIGGSVPINIYMDQYLKSMRLVYNIARQYDPNTWVMGSYTHSWTADGSDGPGYNTYNMLSRTLAYSQAEGDFRWGVAYHPYPQDLTKPRFWKNDTQSTYSMDSPYCTFKNLEVINAWALTPANFYQGTQKRLVFLSENGTNSPDYSTAQLTLQAAGACWAWKKVNYLRGIDGIQWHNWIDNREEFGLRIGLRRFGDDETSPGGPKPVWYVWQAADTDTEDEVFRPYMTTLGITDWDQIFGGNLTGVESLPSSTSAADGVYTLDGTLVGQTADHLPRGLYVIHQGASTRKVLVR